MENANKLNIGTDGFRRSAYTHRLQDRFLPSACPASFFVSVAYDCWAFRRLGVEIDPATGEHHDNGSTAMPIRVSMAKTAGIPLSGREVRLQRARFRESRSAELKVGDIVLIERSRCSPAATPCTSYLMENDAPIDINGGILYHCGPVMLKDDDGDMACQGGRPDDFHPRGALPGPRHQEIRYPRRDRERRHGTRKRSQGLKESGAVYLNAIGGAAQYYAETIKEVTGVHFLEEFGVPEALWQLRVRGLRGNRHNGFARQLPPCGSAGRFRQPARRTSNSPYSTEKLYDRP
jgi:fumarate hydratase class I